ncbi:hypothetical protein AX769_18640 [Frondihabitans sp. PAMC 28766]|nr:hypothetical protein AX769_18640 [Frondihabitans sp. PAMC 28766]
MLDMRGHPSLRVTAGHCVRHFMGENEMTMQRGLDRTEFTTTVVPIQSLGRTALLSAAFSLVPVFAACLWLTARTGTWPVVACVEVIVTAVFFAVFIRFKLVYSAVTPSTLVKRRMVLTATSVDRTAVDHVLISRVYRGSSTESLTQMLVLDAEGRRLFGMSGLFWSEADIRAIAEALDVQLVVDEQPLSRGEYYEMYPTARGWYETRVFRLIAVGVGAIALAGVLAAIEGIVRA